MNDIEWSANSPEGTARMTEAARRVAQHRQTDASSKDAPVVHDEASAQLEGRTPSGKSWGVSHLLRHLTAAARKDEVPAVGRRPASELTWGPTDVDQHLWTGPTEKVTAGLKPWTEKGGGTR